MLTGGSTHTLVEHLSGHTAAQRSSSLVSLGLFQFRISQHCPLFSLCFQLFPFRSLLRNKSKTPKLLHCALAFVSPQWLRHSDYSAMLCFRAELTSPLLFISLLCPIFRLLPPMKNLSEDMTSRPLCVLRGARPLTSC
jgi:hypothetical protein